MSKVLIADQVEEIVMTKMRALFVLMALVLLTPATVRADTITTGTICDNACFWWRPGDNTPDYLGLFGPVFGDLTGQPFTLDISATGYSLTTLFDQLHRPAADFFRARSCTVPSNRCEPIRHCCC